MNRLKRIVDIIMSFILIPLMAYQVTGEAAHEWLGISMVSLVVVHQVLNRKWYASLFKGNYMPFRILSIIINVLLLISFALTAISGISMSNHAVPFLYNLINVNTARVMHLAFSYWAFILMGLHIGMHVNVMTAKIPNNVKNVLAIIFTIISGYGFYLFLKSGIINYITFKTHFAFLDYEKAAPLVFLENILMIIFFAFVGHNISNAIRDIGKKDSDILKLIVYIMASLIIGFILNMSINQNASDNSSWQSASFQNIEMTQNETKVELPQADFSDRILIKSADGKEATIKLIDGKATREFLAQLPMNVSFMDFGKREKFGRVPNSLSEEEALLSRYEIGDFSYGTAYDCLIIFYDQDNEEIDGVLKLGEFETGLENFTNNDNMDVEISIVK